MPFEIKEDEENPGEWYVQNKQTGRRKNTKPLSHAAALRYQRALESNAMGDTQKSVKAAFTAKQQDHLKAIIQHANDLLAKPSEVEGEDAGKAAGMSKAQKGEKLQAIHDHSGDLGAACADSVIPAKAIKAAMKMYDGGMMGDAGAIYARQEMGDISTAAYALVLLCGLQSEMDEAEDAKKLAAIMRSICVFIGGEIDEMEKAAAGDDEPGEVESGEAKSAKIPAQLAIRDDAPKMNLSYAKSMGLAIPDADLTKRLAVKFVGRDEIKHYAMMWGGPSMTDVEREYFKRDTDFWDDPEVKTHPLTWDHGQDQTFKGGTVIGKSVEWGDDDLGRWVISKLDRAHQYRKAIDELIEAGVLGSSSDSAPQYVERVKTGKSTWLKQWPWLATALTDTPAEPRMVGSIEVLKSWGITLPDAPNESARQDERRVLELRERETRLRFRSKLMEG